MRYLTLLTFTFIVAQIVRAEGIGTRGTGMGTRGTGIGTRGTILQNDNPFSTHSSRIDIPSTADDYLGLQIKTLGTVPYIKVFNRDALVLKAILAKYLSSKQKSFDHDSYSTNFSPESFETWATTNAGAILELFEETEWKLITRSYSDENLNYELLPEEKRIEVTSSREGFQQNIRSGMITRSLSLFFIYAGAPSTYEEIYFELYPFEKEIVEYSNSNFN
jgi:hypothetical protein